MAIAGKVAITLSTENGGAWSADVTYDRLVAVKHNNNLYISRKTVANIEPPNNEFWFLALEGFSGDDIEDIINGTTQVGNAKTLDGHGVEYFAPKTDLANYLPLDGSKDMTGNRLGFYRGFGWVYTDSTGVGIISSGTDEAPSDNTNATVLRIINANRYDGGLSNCLVLRYKQNGVSTDYPILHTGNKPTGTYTGDGTSYRTIKTGGIGNAIAIKSEKGTALCVGSFGVAVKSDASVVGTSNVTFANGELLIKTSSDVINASGVTYTYQVL